MEQVKVFLGDIKIPEKKFKSLVAPCLAEAIGTATLIFVGCLGCIITLYEPKVVHFAPFTFGLAVAMAIQMVGHISGGHFNPCVTIAAKIMNRISWLLFPLYIVSQLLGAFAGYGLVMIVTPFKLHSGLCLTAVNPIISIYQALIIETISTALLVMLVCAIWDRRLSGQTDSVSIRLGLILSGLFIAVAPLTGASINPIRSLAPAVYNNYWAAHWIYWVGPILGSIIAAFLYKYAFWEKPIDCQ